MLNLTPRKLASVLTYVGIISLILLLVISCAHAGLAYGTPENPDNLVAEYFSATIVLAVISVLLIIGGIAYRFFTKDQAADEDFDVRGEVDNIVMYSNLTVMNKAKKQRAFLMLKRRDLIDLLCSLAATSCAVFCIDYILFIQIYSYSNIASDIFSTFVKAMLICLVGVVVLLFREQASEDYSEQALALFRSAIKTGISAEDDSDIITMKERDFSQIISSQKLLKAGGIALNYAFLLVVAFTVILPFYWMLISSVKSMTEYMRNPPTLFPEVFHFENYLYAFETASLERLFLNTVFVGVVSTLLSLVITILSAFAFARLEFKGRDALFAALLATMMIPGELFTITNYQTIAALNWEDTYTVLIVPFLVSVFYIYLLRQNFLQIPNELYLAAKVDGTSDFKYLWKVMIPLALPSIISITILKMMGSWNTYVWPNLVISDPDMQLITQGIRNAGFKVDYDPIAEKLVQTMDTNIPIQMAAVAAVSLPLFLVFLFFRKYIMKGVSRSGIKG